MISNYPTTTQFTMSSPMPPPVQSEPIANDGSGTAVSISTPAQSSKMKDQLKCELTLMAGKDPAFLSNLLQPQTRETPADIDTHTHSHTKQLHTHIHTHTTYISHTGILWFGTHTAKQMCTLRLILLHSHIHAPYSGTYHTCTS